MEYPKELTIAINKYNDNLKSIASKILKSSTWFYRHTNRNEEPAWVGE